MKKRSDKHKKRRCDAIQRYDREAGVRTRMNEVDKGKKKLYRRPQEAITEICQSLQEYLRGQVEEHLDDWQDVASCSSVPACQDE